MWRLFCQRLDLISPGAAGVDEVAAPHLELLAPELVAHLGEPALRLSSGGDEAGMVGDERPARGGAAHDLQRESRIVGAGVPVQPGAANVTSLQCRRPPASLLDTDAMVAGKARAKGEQVIGPESRRQLRRSAPAPRDGHQEWKRLHQRGKEPAEPAALLERLMDQTHLPVGKVSNTAVDQLAGAAAGA